MDEHWMPIPGYEGSYEVSDTGRVRSLDRVNHVGRKLRGLILKQIDGTGGYYRVGLHRNGEHTQHHVHRLVLTAFAGSPVDGLNVARHLDGNPKNNSSSNLAWGTTQENILDQIRHGTQVNIKKTHCPKGHAYSGDNLYVEPNGSRRCRRCKRAVLADWKAANPERLRDIQRRANRKYEAKKKAA